MNTEVLISFIIPAYNAADTIEKAVQSLVDVPQAEVLIVENGSKDKTEQVLWRLEKKHNNIKVFTSEKGVSNARNLGVQNATGEWLAFVDADDYLAKSGVTTMMNDARHGKYDFFAYGHVAGQKQNSITDRKRVFEKEKLDEGRIEMIQNPTRYMQVWAKLFRRDIIEKNHIRFDAELPFAEDSDFTLRYMKHIVSICWKPEMVYHYTLNPQSVMHVQTGEKTEKYIRAMEKSAEAIQDEKEIIKKAYDKYVMMHFNIMMVREVFQQQSCSFTVKCKKMKSIAQMTIFKNAIDAIRVKECKSARMLPVLFIKWKWYLGSGIIYYIRVKQNRYKEKDIY